MLILTVLAERHTGIVEENPTIRITRRWSEWTEYSLGLTTAEASSICTAAGITVDDANPTPYRIVFGVRICHHGRTIEFSLLESFTAGEGWVPVDLSEPDDEILNGLLPSFLHEQPSAAELLAIDHVLLRHYLAFQRVLVSN